MSQINADEMFPLLCATQRVVSQHKMGKDSKRRKGKPSPAQNVPAVILNDAALRTPGTIFEFSSAVNNTPKLVAQLRSALAVDHTIRLDRTTAQRELECTAVSVTVSALTVSCGGSLPANVLGTCVAMGFNVAVETRGRNSAIGDLEMRDAFPIVGSLVPQSYSLIGNLFNNEDRLRLVEVLREGSHNGRPVAICECHSPDPVLSRVFSLTIPFIAQRSPFPDTPLHSLQVLEDSSCLIRFRIHP